MSKEIETTKEDGTVEKETVYTKDEYTEKDTALTSAQTELADLKRINAERSNDFKSFSKMTEEEKKVYDANTINLLKREEALSNTVSDLTSKLTEKEKRENESAKTHALSSIHHGDEKSKTTLEEKYALLTGMPETTPEEISARAKEAAKLAGIQIDPRNPLYSPINGEAPQYKPKEEFVETPKGAQAAALAREALGLEQPK